MSATVSNLIYEPLAQEFEELFREHYQMVYRTAFGITGRTEDAEDVLQTVFVRLMRRGTLPDVRKNPKGYLYRAAVNQSLDAVQSRNRHVLKDDLDSLESRDSTACTGSNDNTREWLSQALTQLSPRTVEILILRYEHDYNDVEIAKMLGTSRGVIAVTLYRARARLKKLLPSSMNVKKQS